MMYLLYSKFYLFLCNINYYHLNMIFSSVIIKDMIYKFNPAVTHDSGVCTKEPENEKSL